MDYSQSSVGVTSWGMFVNTHEYLSENDRMDGGDSNWIEFSIRDNYVPWEGSTMYLSFVVSEDDDEVNKIDIPIADIEKLSKFLSQTSERLKQMLVPPKKVAAKRAPVSRASGATSAKETFSLKAAPKTKKVVAKKTDFESEFSTAKEPVQQRSTPLKNYVEPTVSSIKRVKKIAPKKTNPSKAVYYPYETFDIKEIEGADTDEIDEGSLEGAIVPDEWNVKYGDVIAFHEYRDTGTYIVGTDNKLVYSADRWVSGYLSIPLEITRHIGAAIDFYDDILKSNLGMERGVLTHIDIRPDDKFIVDRLTRSLPDNLEVTYVQSEEEDLLEIVYPDKREKSFPVKGLDYDTIVKDPSRLISKTKLPKPKGKEKVSEIEESESYEEMDLGPEIPFSEIQEYLRTKEPVKPIAEPVSAPALVPDLNSKAQKVLKPKGKEKVSEIEATSSPVPILPFFFHFEDKAKAATGDPMKAYLSNWSKSVFQDPIDDITFYANEQYMMYQKARHFNDEETSQAIVDAVTEDDLDLSNTEWNKKMAAVKALGREVKNFNAKSWDSVKEQIVIYGLKYKFDQNEDMKEMLLGTGDAVLVEASPRDVVWGVGVGIEKAKDPKNWRGQNLLGKCLMEVRDAIRRADSIDE